MPNQVVSLPQSGDKAAGGPEEPPHQKWKDEMPLKKFLKGGWQKTFAKDSDQLQQAREDYFRTNCPHFNCETSCDLSGLFQEMIAFADLLGSKIYEIQEAWTGWEDLQYANDALKTSPKGLWFFCPVSPSELPKVMGLKGDHHPDTLCDFTQLTICPWCGKEGQNEGTMVNHLWTTHYKLGLVSNQCLCCPLNTSEAIQCHSTAEAANSPRKVTSKRKTCPHLTN